MTLCREWSLVKHNAPEPEARLLTCKSWNCEYCAPRRRAKLMAQASSGTPTRFITLTVNPDVGDDPEHRLKLLANAWRLVIKRLRRLHPDKEIEYLALVEATKAGEPHLHILFRGPYISQQLLSTFMAELIQSPIVDIRRIKNAKEAIRYVAKYVTKKPAQFGTAKRYWFSQHYQPPYEPDEATEPSPGVRWYIDRRPLHEIFTEWLQMGFMARAGPNNRFFGKPVDGALL